MKRLTFASGYKSIKHPPSMDGIQGIQAQFVMVWTGV